MLRIQGGLCTIGPLANCVTFNQAVVTKTHIQLRIIMYTKIIVLVWAASFVLLAQEPTQARTRVPAGEPFPTTGTADYIITPNPKDIPATLKELVEMSALIIEGTVVKSLPSREPEPRIFHTDAVVQVDELIKGDVTARQILVSQLGGASIGLSMRPVQYTLLEKGERYILFLKQEPLGLSGPVQGKDRFVVSGVWSGLFRSVNGTMAVTGERKDSLRASFAGKAIESIKADVRKLVR
jgi:hypothetical protein